MIILLSRQVASSPVGYKSSSCAAQGTQSIDNHQSNNISSLHSNTHKILSYTMAPSQMDYLQHENATSVGYTHKKFNTGYYKHKKFGKRDSNKDDTPTAPPLFRPYALSDNTPRKRRQESEQRQSQQQPQYQLPPTPPTTPPQQQYQQLMQPQPYQLYTPTATVTPTPSINHQAFAYMLQKQRTVLQMRQLLSINPDANTWPAHLRNALYSMLQQ